MKKKTVTCVLISFILAGCSFKQKIEREIKPVEKYNIQINEEDRACYKDNISEITLEIINNDRWERLLDFECFKNKKSDSSIWRTPGLLFHYLTVKNTGSGPLRITGIRLIYGENEKPVLSADEIKKRLISPAYSMIDFSLLMKDRRLLTSGTGLDDIDFDLDSIEYGLNFVNRGDLISKIIIFEPVPAGYRTYKISIQLESSGDSSTPSFEFNRLEYREKGPFSRPKKDDVEDELW
ncbi:MAG: hypothetical protein MUC95_05700 [Spirochaetes bacterium]|jgi:hypothetical protein|nr:hypothetical protein [Spirochaetota bacterium]